MMPDRNQALPADCLVEVKSCPFEAKLDAILHELGSLKKAFPEDEDGEADFPGHRRYHDAKIAAAKAEETFWRELRLELAKKGAWGLLLIILGLLVAGIAAKTGFTTIPR
jgi:hypothetical protein